MKTNDPFKNINEEYNNLQSQTFVQETPLEYKPTTTEN